MEEKNEKQTKKQVIAVIVMFILITTMFIQTTIAAVPNGSIHGNRTEITSKYIGTTYHETFVFKAGVNKFKKGTWYAYSNGGFYFKIHKIFGKKMRFSFHMPNMNIKKKTAIINSNRKTATAKVKCSRGKAHTLKIFISGSSIKVQEKSFCNKKLLEYVVPTRKKTVTHMFHPEGWIWYVRPEG